MSLESSADKLVMFIILAAFGLCLTSTASAAETSASTSKSVSITLSPVHLAMSAAGGDNTEYSPFFEFTGEYRLSNKLGFAGVAGFGNTTLFPDNPSLKSTTSIYEVGVSPRYYLLGDFANGMQVGGELLYVGTAGEDSSADIGFGASGLSAGAFVGYKIATVVGFTFDSQIGVARTIVEGEAQSNTTGRAATSEESDTTVLLNLNFGWSI